MTNVQGTWFGGQGLFRDRGLTELLREITGRNPSAEVATTFNNPAVYASKGVSTAPAIDYGSQMSRNTMPANGSGSTDNGYRAPGGGGGGGVDQVALAEMARRNRINSYKSQAGNIRNEAQSTFDNLLKSIGAFRERSGTLRDNAGQEIINRSSDILGSNARTGRELEGTTRAQGRALGLGDSSKFINQNKLKANLAATQGNTMARKGEEERSNQALFQERQDEAQGQENEANTYLKGARDRATSVENLGYDAGEEVFANSLNDIVNYQRSLAQINPNTAGLTGYNPDFSGIVNTINGVLGNGGAGGNNVQDDFANPVNPTDVFSLLKKRGLVN